MLLYEFTDEKPDDATESLSANLQDEHCQLILLERGGPQKSTESVPFVAVYCLTSLWRRPGEEAGLFSVYYLLYIFLNSFQLFFLHVSNYFFSHACTLYIYYVVNVLRDGWSIIVGIYFFLALARSEVKWSLSHHCVIYRNKEVKRRLPFSRLSQYSMFKYMLIFTSH